MERRLTRLVWNTNQWEKPISHYWEKKFQGIKGKSFEEQYGYGHEEWLFNVQFNLDGFQYGFIQGANVKEKNKNIIIDELHLYTINSEKGKHRGTTFYLGYISEVEVLDENRVKSLKLNNWIRPFLSDMENDVKNVNGDFSKFRKLKHLPNIRFKFENLNLESVPLVIHERGFNKKYHRYQLFRKPFEQSDDIRNILGIIKPSKTFSFIKNGPGNKIHSFQKNVDKKVGIFEKPHNKIEKDLFEYLKKVVNVHEDNISCGRVNIDENIIDIAVRNSDDTLDIFEIKTTIYVRKNIRDALGQLIDYALWNEDFKTKKLIIVSPAILDNKGKEYFERVKKLISIELEYWQYQINEPNDSLKFMRII